MDYPKLSKYLDSSESSQQKKLYKLFLFLIENGYLDCSYTNCLVWEHPFYIDYLHPYCINNKSYYGDLMVSLELFANNFKKTIRAQVKISKDSKLRCFKSDKFNAQYPLHSGFISSFMTTSEVSHWIELILIKHKNQKFIKNEIKNIGRPKDSLVELEYIPSDTLE